MDGNLFKQNIGLLTHPEIMLKIKTGPLSSKPGLQTSGSFARLRGPGAWAGLLEKSSLTGSVVG